MIKIAHRGNFAGAQPEKENRILYLQDALENGYWIECDVQFFNPRVLNAL